MTVENAASFLVQPPAMLLAAGRGERMRPLTDVTPKPLLKVQGVPLLQLHLQALLAAGVSQAVINTGWLGAQIPAYFGDEFVPQPDGGASAKLSLAYSEEPEKAFETAGGISRALPQLDRVFWLAAGDVYAPDFSFALQDAQAFAQSDELAHLWLVPNPAHNPRGDFGLSEDGKALDLPADDERPRYTYSTIALLKAELFASPWFDVQPGNPEGLRAPLAPLLRRAMQQGRVGASLYTGRWVDVGTPERLAQLNQR
ncbi:nucleotidyltransferase family protein [Comamonas testosteroni]|nr:MULTISPECIES: nucleotidyltransferase family protein [Comamonas]MPS90216.1 nucleotidyltransferase family protein [Comamonas sp.]TYK71266.1 nucleotidyltransferase family protein [Comamonas sp. Z3]WQG68245.1 nucleotidyltransferase family protein [Comamonas testosteroni]